MQMATWAGGWDYQFNQPYALINQKNNLAQWMSRLAAHRGKRAFDAVLIALAGASPGANASYSYPLIDAVQAVNNYELGGKRTISQKSLINRATTAADVSYVGTIFNPSFAPATYPVDKSGNGGGGKTGTF